MAVDPNMLAALESFAGDPASAGGGPAPVLCKVCDTLIDPVTGDPAGPIGGTPAPAPAAPAAPQPLL